MKYSLLLIFCIIGWACSFKPSYSFNAVKSIKVLTVTSDRRCITARKFDRSYMKRFSTEKTSSDNDEDDIDETTKKYGLEAGLFKAITSKDEVTNELKPKQLLAKYGIAYLVTSISLALVSFSLCYILVSNGVDVASILTKFGIESSVTAANAGTFALAYAVHKAASPIRFPPTVFLTPIVAGLIGKGTEKK